MMLLALAAITLAGAVDIHVHCDPDSLPRSLDAIEVARLAKARGMRAIVLKNHFESTAGLAYLTRKQVAGIEVFGGIDLNGTVGGINPAAVEQMVKVKGGYGRVVWLPTFDAEHDTLAAEHPRPRVPVAGNGTLLPAVRQIIGLAAKHKLTLETGHSSPEESLLVVEEARRQGVQHVVVTHAMLCGMTIAQMKQAAAAGAYIEFVYNALTGSSRRFQPSEYAAAIRAIGVDRVILSSDLGQANNPPAPDGLLTFLQLMEKEGFSAAEIHRMSAANPATVLGLSPTY